MKRIVGAVTGLAILAGASFAWAEEAKRIEFGVHTPQEDVSWERLVESWKEIEALGYDSVWLYDHFMPLFADEDAPVLEAWTTLAALARETEQIRVGILVTGNTYRNPALLAKMATTVDHSSGGRLEFGIGAAWHEPEHRAYGFDFYTAKERAERFAEAMEVIHRLWTREAPSYEGTFYSLKDAPFQPAPVQRPHPPIVIGGQGKKWIMPTVARYADEWNVPIGVTPDGVRERIRIMEQVCEEVGRDPCVQEVSVFLPLVNITNIPLAGPVTRLGARLITERRIADSILAGSAGQIRERLQEFVDAGATKFIVNVRPPFDRELLETFMDEVVSEFR